MASFVPVITKQSVLQLFNSKQPHTKSLMSLTMELIQPENKETEYNTADILRCLLDSHHDFYSRKVSCDTVRQPRGYDNTYFINKMYFSSLLNFFNVVEQANIYENILRNCQLISSPFGRQVIVGGKSELEDDTVRYCINRFCGENELKVFPSDKDITGGSRSYTELLQTLHTSLNATNTILVIDTQKNLGKLFLNDGEKIKVSFSPVSASDPSPKRTPETSSDGHYEIVEEYEPVEFINDQQRPGLGGISFSGISKTNNFYETQLTMLDTTQKPDPSLIINVTANRGSRHVNSITILSKQLEKYTSVINHPNSSDMSFNYDLTSGEDFIRTANDKFKNSFEKNRKYIKYYWQKLTQKRLGDELQAEYCKLKNATSSSPNAYVLVTIDRMLFAHCIIRKIPCIFDHSNKKTFVCYCPDGYKFPLGQSGGRNKPQNILFKRNKVGGTSAAEEKSHPQVNHPPIPMSNEEISDSELNNDPIFLIQYAIAKYSKHINYAFLHQLQNLEQEINDEYNREGIQYRHGTTKPKLRRRVNPKNIKSSVERINYRRQLTSKDRKKKRRENITKKRSKINVKGGAAPQNYSILEIKNNDDIDKFYDYNEKSFVDSIHIFHSPDFPVQKEDYESNVCVVTIYRSVRVFHSNIEIVSKIKTLLSGMYTVQLFLTANIFGKICHLILCSKFKSTQDTENIFHDISLFQIDSKTLKDSVNLGDTDTLLKTLNANIIKIPNGSNPLYGGGIKEPISFNTKINGNKTNSELQPSILFKNGTILHKIIELMKEYELSILQDPEAMLLEYIDTGNEFMLYSERYEIRMFLALIIQHYKSGTQKYNDEKFISMLYFLQKNYESTYLELVDICMYMSFIKDKYNGLFELLNNIKHHITFTKTELKSSSRHRSRKSNSIKNRKKTQKNIANSNRNKIIEHLVSRIMTTIRSDNSLNRAIELVKAQRESNERFPLKEHNILVERYTTLGGLQRLWDYYAGVNVQDITQPTNILNNTTTSNYNIMNPSSKVTIKPNNPSLQQSPTNIFSFPNN